MTEVCPEFTCAQSTWWGSVARSCLRPRLVSGLFLPWDSRTPSAQQEKIWRLPALTDTMFGDLEKAIITLQHTLTHPAQAVVINLMTQTWINVLFGVECREW